MLAFNFLENKVFYGGLIISGGVVIHLLLSQYTGALPFMKEWSVALYYTLGIWMAPILLTERVEFIQILILVLFYLTVLISLFIFSYMEIDADSKDGSHSAAVYLGKRKTAQLIRFGFGLSFVITGFLAVYDFMQTGQKYFWLAPFIILVVHFFLFMFPDKFRRNERYRLLGDGIFIIYFLSTARSGQ